MTQQEIILNKKHSREILLRQKNRFIAIGYGMLGRNKNLKEIKTAFQQQVKRYGDTKEVRDLANIIYKKIAIIKKRANIDFETTTLNLALGSIFLLLNKYKINEKSIKYIHKVLNKQEEKNKKIMIKDMLETAKNQKSVFFLCSHHQDCAKDHVDYQGKVYVDANWKQYITDKQDRQDIQNYISRNDVKTFQWVIGKPVWLITRPNCRHFFKNISNDEILRHNVGYLLEQNKMNLRVGNRPFVQTLGHSTKRDWYTVENVENITQRYKERLAFHSEMLKYGNSELLKNAVVKDKLLIEKWQNYLKDLKK